MAKRPPTRPARSQDPRATQDLLDDLLGQIDQALATPEPLPDLDRLLGEIDTALARPLQPSEEGLTRGDRSLSKATSLSAEPPPTAVTMRKAPGLGFPGGAPSDPLPVTPRARVAQSAPYIPTDPMAADAAMLGPTGPSMKDLEDARQVRPPESAKVPVAPLTSPERQGPAFTPEAIRPMTSRGQVPRRPPATPRTVPQQDILAAASGFTPDAIQPRPSHGIPPRMSAAPVERTVADVAENVGRASAAGVMRVFTVPFYAAIQAAGDALGLESVSEFGRWAGQEATKNVEAVRGPQTGAGPNEQAAYSGFESIGVTAPALVAAALTGGNPWVALGLMGASTAGESYPRAREKGVSPLQAANYAAVQGAVEVLTEKIPASRLLGDLAKQSGLMQTLLRQVVAEVPGEQVATVVQDLNDWVTLNPEAPFSAYLAERPSAAVQTFIATVVGTVVQTAGAVGVERVTRPSMGAPPVVPPVKSQPVTRPPRVPPTAQAPPIQPPVAARPGVTEAAAAVIPEPTPAPVVPSAAPPDPDLIIQQIDDALGSQDVRGPDAAEADRQALITGARPSPSRQYVDSVLAEKPSEIDDVIAAIDQELWRDDVKNLSDEDLARRIVADVEGKERPDAISERPAASLDVGEPSRHGATVGEGDARRQVTPRAEAPREEEAPDTRDTAEEVEPGTVHKFSSTQVDLPDTVVAGIQKLAATIPDEDLTADGRESDPHVTVKYGIHSADPEVLRPVLAGEGPITVRLGKTSHFADVEDGTADAVLVEIDSPDLHRLNAKIAQALDVTDTHPTYTPHATVAYVKPGLGAKYSGKADLEGQTVTLDAITFSGKNGDVVRIPLTGQATTSDEPVSIGTQQDIQPESPHRITTGSTSIPPRPTIPVTPKAEAPPPVAKGQIPITPEPEPPAAPKTNIGTTGDPKQDRRLATLRARQAKGRGMTAAEEKALAIYEARAAADPLKWAVGDGVGWRVTGQINRGFQIVEIDPDKKLARVRSVADTGMTTTGGQTDRIADELVPLGDLVRDRKYDAAPSTGSIPVTPRKTKPKGDEATFIGPRKIGGRYFDSYWGKEYTVVAISRDETGRPTGITVKDADGTRAHRTAWATRDRIIEQPAVSAATAPAKEALPVTPKARLSIRASEYRGKSGFSISGRDAQGRRVKVFAESREAAEHIKAKLARGEEPTVADFQQPTSAKTSTVTPKKSRGGRGGISGFPITPRQAGSPTQATRGTIPVTPRPESEAKATAAQRPPDPIREDVIGVIGAPAGMPFRMAEDLVATPVTERGRRVSLTEIIKSLAHVTAATGKQIALRVGRVGGQRRGQWNPQTHVARTRAANDVPTATHEVAHALQTLLLMSGRPGRTPWVRPRASNAMQRELVALGKTMYRERTPVGGYKSEGWAEFVRMWVTGSDLEGQPADLSTLAPTTLGWFNDTFSRDYPDVREALDRTRDLTRRWRTQGARTRASMSVVDTGSIVYRVKAAGRQVRRFISMEKLVEMAQPLHELAREAESVLGQPLAPSEDPFFSLSALRTTHDARVKYMVDTAMINLAGNLVGPPLNDIRPLVKGKREEFTLYLWARRSLALINDPRGPRHPGLTKADAEQIVRELDSPAFQLAASKVYAWNRAVLDYPGQASPTFARVVAAVRRRDPGDYVPLQREFEELDDLWARSAKPKVGTASTSSPVKRMKGSGRRVKDLFPVMIAQASNMVRQAHQRLVLDQVIKLARLEGMGNLIEEVRPDQRPVTAETVEDILRKVNREVSEPIETGDMSPDDLAAAVTFFAPMERPKGKDPILPITDEQGKVRWYQMDGQLFDALSSLDVYRLPDVAGLPIAEWLLGKPAALFRAGTTGLRASFGLIWNPTKDIQTMAVNTRANRAAPVLFAKWARAMGGMALSRTSGHTSQWVDAWIRLGGEMAQPLGQDIPHTRRAARQLFQGRTVRTLDPRNWFDFYRDLVQFPEGAPRVAELQMVAEEIGWQPGTPMTLDQSLTLLLASKQVTTDFTAAGEIARVVNRMAPFHNAAIQGPRANLRALKHHPARFAWRGLQLATLTLLLWWKYKDEEWYTNMNYRERFLHWFFPVEIFGRNELIRIPRAFEVGMIFAALPEMLMDAWYREDPKAVKEWFKALDDVARPETIESIVPLRVAREQWQNRQWPDRPIVPMSMQRKPAAEQFTEYTSRAAIQIGDMFNVSPLRIDHAIRGTFGPVSMDLLTLIGAGPKGSGREGEPADWALLGRLFQRGGEVGVEPKPVKELYALAEEAQLRQHSDKMPEDSVARQRRLQLEDATTAVSALLTVRRYAASVDQRRTLTTYTIRVAKEALIAHKRGSIHRAHFATYRRAAEWQKEQELAKQKAKVRLPVTAR